LVERDSDDSNSPEVAVEAAALLAAADAAGAETALPTSLADTLLPAVAVFVAVAALLADGEQPATASPAIAASEAARMGFVSVIDVPFVAILTRDSQNRVRLPSLAGGLRRRAAGARHGRPLRTSPA
jgi:hypothetical protein